MNENEKDSDFHVNKFKEYTIRNYFDFEKITNTYTNKIENYLKNSNNELIDYKINEKKWKNLFDDKEIKIKANLIKFKKNEGFFKNNFII